VSLVTREDGTKKLRELQLAHFSVKEYLTSSKLVEPFQYKFSEANARGCITLVCLTYLMCLDHDSQISKIDAAFPLARYSARYWMDHARLAETLDDVQVSVLTFFENKTAYPIWRRSYEFDALWNPDPRPGPNSPPKSPLYYASLQGLRFTVQQLLEKGADINAQEGSYANALQAASAGGHGQVVKLLLDNGADVNKQGGGYGDALHKIQGRGGNAS